MPSDLHEIKLEVSNRKIIEKSQYIWRLRKIFLYNTWVEEEIPQKTLKYFELN